jgi:hypothetical protein
VIDPAAFSRDGAARVSRALTLEDVALLHSVAGAVAERPGARLTGDMFNDLLTTGAPTRIAAHLTSARTRPVRAVMFDKGDASNWRLGWHQDRTIVVRRRVDVAGFGPWSMKQGLQHVAPPFEMLERMVTLRLHIDPVDDGNAPLLVARGSHRTGRVPAAEAAARASEFPQITCLAEPGDVWAYSTPILHASERAQPGRRRRVLQVDYADFDLPAPLVWHGI